MCVLCMFGLRVRNEFYNSIITVLYIYKKTLNKDKLANIGIY